MLVRLAPIVLCALVATALAADFTPPVPMASYQFGLLRRGPAWTPKRTPATDSIQAGHMANIVRMANEGVLLGAGPFLDGGDLRGVFIFRADSIEKLRRLAARDPALRSKRLVLDLWSWYAPAGIGEPWRALAKEPGHRDSMVKFQLVLLKQGPRWSAEDTPENRKLQEEHLSGIFRALLSGEAALAGPVDGPGDLAGLWVFRGDSATAWGIASQDPRVKAGQLVAEMHPWIAAYGVMPGDTL